MVLPFDGEGEKGDRGEPGKGSIEGGEQTSSC
jgi:hypothetical protein